RVNVILLNKPFGVLCQFTDRAGRPTLADFVRVRDVYPAGRLDHDSEGLLVLTDDGALQARLADPRHHVEKTYWAQVEGEPTPEALGGLPRGRPPGGPRASHPRAAGASGARSRRSAGDRLFPPRGSRSGCARGATGRCDG